MCVPPLGASLHTPTTFALPSHQKSPELLSHCHEMELLGKAAKPHCHIGELELNNPTYCIWLGSCCILYRFDEEPSVWLLPDTASQILLCTSVCTGMKNMVHGARFKHSLCCNGFYDEETGSSVRRLHRQKGRVREHQLHPALASNTLKRQQLQHEAAYCCRRALRSPRRQRRRAHRHRPPTFATRPALRPTAPASARTSAVPTRSTTGTAIATATASSANADQPELCSRSSVCGGLHGRNA